MPLPGGSTPAGPAPASYTPKHLAERILTSKSALEGERKQVTVLFADLKGSMELLADRDPEEARKLLDPVLEHMMEAVHRYEGTVNQVMGDGIMALFGAPVAHEDHGVRACYAALDMQARVRRYAEEVRRAHGVKAQIRVGLNSGEVVVRAIGSDLHMDYTAVGQTTHLAARMEQLADPGTVLLTATTLRLAEGYVAVKPLGPVPVKGLEGPVEVYELSGAGPSRSRLHAAAARGLTRFVGRQGELEQLWEALGRAATGHGQVVAIVGEPGVGKSRLVWEVTHSHRIHGWVIVQGSSVSYGKATTYLPAIDLLKGYFQIEDRDDQRKIREKVMGKLLALDRTLEPSLPALLALLDVPLEESHWQALDPPERRQRTLEALRRLLLRESQVQPILVVFEDLHWIDSETQALLDSMVESLPAARLVLLVNYRPEYEHSWGSETYYTQLRLDSLPAESAEELLRALLGTDPGLQPLKRLLIERTEGNPFFLEESVHALVEAGVLAGDRGAQRLTKTIESIQVPATVQAILAARIDRLQPEEKMLLQTASVIGAEVPLSLLHVIAEKSVEELRRELSHLQAAEFLYETGLFPDVEYTFKHALTHEVAYQSVLRDRRRALHARLVEATEMLYGDRLAEQVARLAHHAVRGELWAKAAMYLRQAGGKAISRSANREAVACLEQGLRALTHLPDSNDRLVHEIDIRLDLKNALLALGELDQISSHLHRATVGAERLGDERRRHRALWHMCQYSWLLGDHSRALELGEQALAIARALGDVSLEVETKPRLGAVYHSVGDYRRAVEILAPRLGEVVGRSDLPGVPYVYNHLFLIWSLVELGEFAQAARIGVDTLRTAEAFGHPWALVDASMGAGVAYIGTGQLSRAIEILESGLRLCDVATLPLLYPWIASHLGHAYLRADRVDEAVRLLEQSVGQIKAQGTRAHQPIRMVRLSESYLLNGRREVAIRTAHEALDLARDLGERGHEAWASWVHGVIAASGDRAESEPAMGFYEHALTLSTELGMRPLVARCHLGLGKLHRQTSDRAKAEEHLATGATMCREMGMAF